MVYNGIYWGFVRFDWIFGDFIGFQWLLGSPWVPLSSRPSQSWCLGLGPEHQATQRSWIRWPVSASCSCDASWHPDPSSSTRTIKDASICRNLKPHIHVAGKPLGNHGQAKKDADLCDFSEIPTCPESLYREAFLLRYKGILIYNTCVQYTLHVEFVLGIWEQVPWLLQDKPPGLWDWRTDYVWYGLQPKKLQLSKF